MPPPVFLTLLLDIYLGNIQQIMFWPLPILFTLFLADNIIAPAGSTWYSSLEYSTDTVLASAGFLTLLLDIFLGNIQQIIFKIISKIIFKIISKIIFLLLPALENILCLGIISKNIFYPPLVSFPHEYFWVNVDIT